MLMAICGCGSTQTSTPTTTMSTPAGPDQTYQKLACLSVPEDLRWEYLSLYGSNGRLKPLNEIKSMPADQAFGPNPTSDLTALYETVTSRYGHPPACGEPYPAGSAGQLNENVMDHKALSCKDIPPDLRERYSDLFESNGRLKSWKAIATTPIDPAYGSLEGEIPALYNEVVSRVGHPISCPAG
ncbi:hypothetical protein [Nocardia terpenica]|uniref:Uncharacterized protein n=1 Tax=Nocardia terpenica TaxID=455432 RepID=A0A6G9Z241_9NOCA|nr:hypothetical protein [Nocardia terpenica]QIS19276.1 hypothetical protein F6W96_14260 [Nocardia terpenica]